MGEEIGGKKSAWRETSREGGSIKKMEANGDMALGTARCAKQLSLTLTPRARKRSRANQGAGSGYILHLESSAFLLLLVLLLPSRRCARLCLRACRARAGGWGVTPHAYLGRKDGERGRGRDSEGARERLGFGDIHVAASLCGRFAATTTLAVRDPPQVPSTACAPNERASKGPAATNAGLDAPSQVSIIMSVVRGLFASPRLKRREVGGHRCQAVCSCSATCTRPRRGL